MLLLEQERKVVIVKLDQEAARDLEWRLKLHSEGLLKLQILCDFSLALSGAQYRYFDPASTLFLIFSLFFFFFFQAEIDCEIICKIEVIPVPQCCWEKSFATAHLSWTSVLTSLHTSCFPNVFFFSV